MDNGAQWSFMTNHMHLLCSRVPDWSGQWIRLQDLIFPDLRSFLKFPTTTNNEASTRSRWRQNALQAPPKVLQRITGWDGHGPFLAEGLRCITWITRGLIGSVFSKQKNREFKLKYLKKSFINNNSVCLQEVHGKDENLQAIQVLAPRFRIFGTFFPENENAGGSAVCIHRDLQPEEAIVTHFSYVSRPRSYCPHTIWETKLSDRQRPFLNLNLACGNYVADYSYSPALACISQWGGHYFG